MKKGLRRCGGDIWTATVGPNRALMKKGLRPRSATFCRRIASSEQSPDEEGIKTRSVCAAYRGAHGPNRALMKKGLRPSAMRHSGEFQRPNRALMKKGLRRLSGVDVVRADCPNRALMKKGLRHFRRDNLSGFPGSEPSPDEEGIKTAVHPSKRLDAPSEPSPDEEGIKTTSPPGPCCGRPSEPSPDEEGIKTPRSRGG